MELEAAFGGTNCEHFTISRSLRANNANHIKARVLEQPRTYHRIRILLSLITKFTVARQLPSEAIPHQSIPELASSMVLAATEVEIRAAGLTTGTET